MICPKCHQKLLAMDHCFVCKNHHSYDIARQGYVNLNLDHSKMSGDSKEMVLARHLFLNKGYYEPLQRVLEEIVIKYQLHTLADLGCGEGYYTQKMSLHTEKCYGFDLSKDALKIAAREDKNCQYVVASIFHLPLEDESVEAISNVFAPSPLDECVRVLKRKGLYIRVTPHSRHLFGLKEKLYDKPYENEIELLFDERFELIERILVQDMIEIKDQKDIEALFMMTPYYWKSSREASKKVKQMEKLTTEIAFDVQIYEKKD